MRSVDVMFVLLGGSVLIVVRTARKGRTMKAARKAPTIMMKWRAWKNSGLWGPNTAIHTEFNPEKKKISIQTHNAFNAVMSVPHFRQTIFQILYRS